MINCPNCGGGVRRLTPLRRSRTCPYCGHEVFWRALDPPDAESHAVLPAVPPFIELGRGVRLDGEPFVIGGALRLANAHRAVDRWWLEPIEPGAPVGSGELVDPVGRAGRGNPAGRAGRGDAAGRTGREGDVANVGDAESGEGAESAESGESGESGESAEGAEGIGGERGVGAKRRAHGVSRGRGHWIESDGERYRLLVPAPTVSSLEAILPCEVGRQLSDEEDAWLVTERWSGIVASVGGDPPGDAAPSAPVRRAYVVGDGRRVVFERIGERFGGFSIVELDDSRLVREPALDRDDACSAAPAPSPSTVSDDPRAPLAAPFGLAAERTVSVFTCARCGGALESRLRGSLRIVCRACGALTDIARVGADATVEAAARAFDHRLATERVEFGLGSTFLREGDRWQVVGVQVFAKDRAGRGDAGRIDRHGGYTLWWLVNGRREMAWLGEQAGLRFWSEPAVPDDAALPERNSRAHEFGEWTLVDAAGEFPYRIEPGERHRTIEADAWRGGTMIELYLDDDGRPWRIRHSTRRPLDDIEVLEGLSDRESIARLRRWRRAKWASTALGIGAIVAATLVSATLPSVAADGLALGLLVLGLVGLVSAGACEAVATWIGHGTAYLTRDAPAGAKEGEGRPPDGEDDDLAGSGSDRP